MDNKEVIVLPGDGIGPEITEATLAVLSATNPPLTFTVASAGADALESEGEVLPRSTLAQIKQAGVALKGPITTPIGKGRDAASSFRSVNVQLRKELDLFANVRPIMSIPGVESRFQGVDLVFVRENTEGLYVGIEQEIVPDVVTSIKVSTRAANMRIAEYAFALARSLKRKKVTGIHKANILKLGDGLALECYRTVAERFPDIEYDERIIDAAAMLLVMKPESFDVLLTENLYGDILSDLGAGLVGGLGLAPSANLGLHCAVFEAVHGSAPDIAGKGVANPTALILSAVQMLEHLNLHDYAQRIRAAVFRTLLESKTRTRDLGGSASTKEYTAAIIAAL